MEPKLTLEKSWAQLYAEYLSRPPSSTRQADLVRRIRKLDLLRASVEQAIEAFKVATRSADGAKDLRLRHGFVYLKTPLTSGSDRRVPPRNVRPPATRIATSRGLALRLELTALALAQATHRAGRAAKNRLPLRPDSSDESPIGWIDLVASPAEYRRTPRSYSTVDDKKFRQVQSALRRLSDAQLVDLPRLNIGQRDATDYENFRLLDERGGREVGPPIDYQVPKIGDPTFKFPAAFINNGWIHVLEDSEISFLLMVACGLGRNPGEEDIAIPAEVRLLHYGISRDAFDSHFLLERLGLLNVQEVGRHDDGRAENYDQDGARLHRLRLLPEGFEQDALQQLKSVIEDQLRRGAEAPV